MKPQPQWNTCNSTAGFYEENILFNLQPRTTQGHEIGIFHMYILVWIWLYTHILKHHLTLKWLCFIPKYKTRAVEYDHNKEGKSEAEEDVWHEASTPKYLLHPKKVNIYS